MVIEKRNFGEASVGTLPLVIRPTGGVVDPVEWIGMNKATFERDLLTHGGVLLRGFGVTTPEGFKAFVDCWDSSPLPYMFRSSPREELKSQLKNIYLSTVYPNERHIQLHNESSYSRVWGRKIIFCCLTPAEEGGETPIADSRKVLADIHPELVRKFRILGVKYRRNLFPEFGMHWQEVFQTMDKNIVMEICRKNDIRCIFKDDDELVIEWVKPAVYCHPVTKEETWFNHVLFFNKFARYEELELAPDDAFPEEYLTSDTFFGDGSEISHEEYLDIRQAYVRNTIAIPYEQGDILFLDNMLSAHGRNPYKGKRVIATAIIEAAFDEGYDRLLNRFP